MSQRRVAVRVSGLVQGVFFRAATEQEATRLGVTGWVANSRAGHVEGEFQGDPEAVEELLAFCARGPRSADVDDVEVTELESRADESGFTVR